MANPFCFLKLVTFAMVGYSSTAIHLLVGSGVDMGTIWDCLRMLIE